MTTITIEREKLAEVLDLAAELISDDKGGWAQGTSARRKDRGVTAPTGFRLGIAVYPQDGTHARCASQAIAEAAVLVLDAPTDESQRDVAFDQRVRWGGSEAEAYYRAGMNAVGRAAELPGAYLNDERMIAPVVDWNDNRARGAEQVRGGIRLAAEQVRGGAGQ